MAVRRSPEDRRMPQPTTILEAVYARHKAPLVRYAERLLRDRASVAEDVVQEAFVRAHRSFADAGGGDVSLVKWLYTVVRNAAIDELRRHGRVVPSDRADHFAGTEDPVSLAGTREELRSVLADVVALPDRQRTALLAHAVDGVPHRVIAHRTGGTEAGSKALVNRARDSLHHRRDLRAAA